MVARQLGKVCLVNCPTLRVRPLESSCTIGAHRLQEGDAITLDADNGRVHLGRLPLVREQPPAEIDQVRRWRESARRGPTSVANSSLSEVSQAGAALFRT